MATSDLAMQHTQEHLRPVVTYERDAILETAHIAAALGVSDEIVGKMDLPHFYAGKRMRFIWGQVLDALAERATKDARPRKVV